MTDPSLRTTRCTLLRAATLARNFFANGKKEFEVWTEMHVSVATRTCLITVECCVTLFRMTDLLMEEHFILDLCVYLLVSDSST